MLFQERVQLAGHTSSVTDISGLSQNLLEEKNQEIDHLSEQVTRLQTEYQELQAEKGVERMVGYNTVQPVYNGHSQKRQKLVFKLNYRLMQVKNIAECSKGSILQYFRPSLSYHSSFNSLFCLFLSGCLRQVLLYSKGSAVAQW